MIKIAIIQFPGLNTEYETRREINKCGMTGEFFRWNEPAANLKKYDGYVIGGGFSYEDRGRAGVIASLDPIMEGIKKEAATGKPVLGICNGAQILVESGLIPGVDGNKLAMALARNKRIKDGDILGTGYYNAWVHLKCVSKPGDCMFAWNINEGEILKAPVAHGEGRFTSDIPELMQQLQSKHQMVMRYCDANGVITEDFPVNPNGAMFNLAAVCNPAGNVMAVMPHLERDFSASAKLFTSMRDAIMARKTGGIKKRTPHLMVKPVQFLPLKRFEPQERSIQMFVSLIITDNEAETYAMTLKNLGWPKATLKRKLYFEISYQGKPDLQKIMKKLIQSGVLINTNKEAATVQFPKERLKFDAKREKFTPAPETTNEQFIVKRVLIKEKPDFVGISKLSTIQKRLKLEEITGLSTGTLWEIQIPTKSKNVAEEEFKHMMQTHLFSNPHRQEALLI